MLFQLLEVAVILAVFFLLSIKFGFLDRKGSLLALIIGALVGIFGSVSWLILMIVFAVSSFAATKAWFKYKKRKHLQEGTNGERRVSNVLYAGLPGLIVVFFNALNTYWLGTGINFFLIFAVSYAAVTADTFASEIGIIDTKVVLVTTLKKTKQGVNGGVSVIGTLASFAGGIIIAASYDILTLTSSLLINILIIGLGALGSLIDSVLGATLENQDRLGKGHVNFIASISCVILASAFLLL